MQASVVLLLGETLPGPPSTWRGTTLNAAAAVAVLLRNLRRVISVPWEVVAMVFERFIWFMTYCLRVAGDPKQTRTVCRQVIWQDRGRNSSVFWYHAPSFIGTVNAHDQFNLLKARLTPR